MVSPRSLRILAMALTSALLVGGFAVVPQGARADANAPRWASGDWWVYVDANNRNHTLRIDAVGQENVQTIRGTTYEAFHFKETDSTGSVALISDTWVRQSDLGLVKTSATFFNVVTVVTFDPPQSQAYFPLSRLKSWQVALTVSSHIGGFWGNASATLSFQVDNELDVTVPAGTFHSFSIRTLGGGAYGKAYYSEQPGYWSKRETYDAQDRKTGEMDLAQYRYQWNTTFLVIVIGAIAVIAVFVFALLWRKRKRSLGLPGGPQPPQMSSPPPPPRP
jgi:hypothetical protein